MAKLSRKILSAIFVAALIFAMGKAFFKVENIASADEASAEIVTEVYSGRVLYGSNIDIAKPMASTTKILTAIIIIEDCPLDKVVKIPKQAAGVEGSSVYLKEGESFTVLQLLYGLMLRSGNDCSVALAIAHSGSVKAFVDEMNLRAKQMGAINSHFKNPNGLPDENHYTTAYDLSLIACYALKNDTFAKIVSTKYYPECGWKNKNKMLFNYDGADGVKTGYTQKAGRCLVTSAKRNGMWLVCVVLNCSDMYGVSESLLNDAFSAFNYSCVFSEKVYLVPSDVEGKNISVGEEKDFFYPLRQEELELIQIKKELPPFCSLPIKKGEVVGNIKIYFANQLIFSENLCSIVEVNKTYTDILKEVAKKFNL